MGNADYASSAGQIVNSAPVVLASKYLVPYPKIKMSESQILVIRNRDTKKL